MGCKKKKKKHNAACVGESHNSAIFWYTILSTKTLVNVQIEQEHL